MVLAAAFPATTVDRSLAPGAVALAVFVPTATVITDQFVAAPAPALDVTFTTINVNGTLHVVALPLGAEVPAAQLHRTLSVLAAAPLAAVFPAAQVNRASVTLSDQDISSALLTHTYTADADRSVSVRLFADQVAGDNAVAFEFTEQRSISWDGKTVTIGGVDSAGGAFSWEAECAQVGHTVTVTIQDLDAADTDLAVGVGTWQLEGEPGADGRPITAVEGRVRVKRSLV